MLAKPAEQTPLIAAQAVRLLLEAGIPEGVVQLLPGRGETVGAGLVGDERVKGVMFTGSTEVARLLQRNVAGRLDSQGRPIPLIAETGGQNAMIVDSSALTEQVVIDVVSSAFDSAGQRCSALRVLCLQEDSADRVIEMLKGRDGREPPRQSGAPVRGHRPGDRRRGQGRYRKTHPGHARQGPHGLSGGHCRQRRTQARHLCDADLDRTGKLR